MNVHRLEQIQSLYSEWFHSVLALVPSIDYASYHPYTIKSPFQDETFQDLINLQEKYEHFNKYCILVLIILLWFSSL